MKDPLVSVIIPTWNRVRFLPSTINSVLSQDYPHIELIVVDDNSNDGTDAVIERWPEVDYCKLADRGGQAHCRNIGLDRAKGDLIHPMDSDDLLAPGAISHHVRYLQEHKDVDLVFSDFQVFRGKKLQHIRKGAPITWDVKQTILQNLGKTISSYGSISRLNMQDMSANLWCNGNTTYRKCNLRYDVRVDWPYNAGADQHFWVRLGLLGYKFQYLPGVVMYYRLHNSNLFGSGAHISLERMRQLAKTRMYALSLIKADAKKVRAGETFI